jgi:signal transduction histidine kinase
MRDQVVGRAAACAITVAALVEQLARPDTAHSAAAVAWVLALGATLIAAWSAPVAATWAAAALAVAAPRSGPPFPPTVYMVLLPVVLAYACGTRASTRSGLVALAALAVAIQVHVGFAHAPDLEILLGILPPWWVGRQVLQRRTLVAQLATRTHELERAEEAFIALAVERERARIARDLHDIVSHHLAVMVIQAGAGRLAAAWDADVAAERFATIHGAGAEALAESEQLVTLLAPHQPSLADLLSRTEKAGTHVAIDTGTIPPATQTIAYRVIQEALTNAMKHAPGAPVAVDVRSSGNALRITVDNDAPTSTTTSTLAATGSGLGLAGMRERINAMGGTLSAAPTTDGGFHLEARLPMTG